jgi:enoyl-CoA hydratase/carnithine racemase
LNTPPAGNGMPTTGVLEVALHSDGGTLVFNGHTHEQFVDLFHAIGSDLDNRVVVLTGSGTAFMESISPEGFDFFTPRGYDKIYREGKKVLMNILDIEVPLIAAVNGPVRLHSEYVLLADIVLATPATVFQDRPHFDFGIVPGDGVNLLWRGMCAAATSSSPAGSSMRRRRRNGARSTKLFRPTSYSPALARSRRGSPSCHRSPRSIRASQ